MHAFGIHIDVVRRKKTETTIFAKDIAFIVPVQEVDLDGIVTISKCQFSSLDIIFHRDGWRVVISPTELQLACVAANLITTFAAQQLMQRHLQCFAFDIPQSDVNGADAAVPESAAVLSPKGAKHHVIPKDFVGKRILSHNQRP